MGSTPIHNIPFAEPTDLVREWPALSEDVAFAIEAALENIPVTQKKIEAFTGDGTWTVPAGVTYAIAHMVGGGGGAGRTSSGGSGSASSVDFSGGLVSAAGGAGGATTGTATTLDPTAGAANSGEGARTGLFSSSATGGHGAADGANGARIVAGGAVTPAEDIAVTVGNGGTAGSGGAAGGSGYVYIEYFEEV